MLGFKLSLTSHKASRLNPCILPGSNIYVFCELSSTKHHCKLHVKTSAADNSSIVLFLNTDKVFPSFWTGDMRKQYLNYSYSIFLKGKEETREADSSKGWNARVQEKAPGRIPSTTGGNSHALHQAPQTSMAFR